MLKIKNDMLRLSTSKIRVKMKLKQLKKLDLSGCLIKVDSDVKAIGSKDKYYKMVKKKALGKNYHKVAW